MAAALLLRFRALIASCFLRSAPASPPALEDDDMLLEILLRLPPLPSFLLRASLVCKRWRCLLSDPGFLRRFRDHHRRTPTLLGFFFEHGPVFVPTLSPPNRIPRGRFSLPHPRNERLFLLGFRHGLALLINRRQLEAVVWDPITGCQHTVPYAPEFKIDGGKSCFYGAVLGAAHGDGHGCLGPFGIVLIRTAEGHGHTTSVFMCHYESATGKWSNTSSTVIPSSFSILPDVLVRNALCGFFHWPTGILEFDLDTKTVGVIQKPKSIHSFHHSFFRVVRTKDKGLGLATLRATSIGLWGRKFNSDGSVAWVLQKTIELDVLIFSLVPTAMHEEWQFPRMVGYDEDSNVIHIATTTGVFTIQLESLQCTELFISDCWISSYYPYTSFRTLGERRCLPGSHAKMQQ